MPKTIVIVGYGPGISAAVAEKFGGEGYAVAAIARNAERLDAGVAALRAKGIEAAGVPADASDPVALRAAIATARSVLGAIGVVHWNAFSGGNPGDLLGGDPAALRAMFDVPIVGLLSAVQETLPDLKAAGDGAVLVTNGAFGENNPQIDAAATGLKVMDLALANAAKHKLVGLLSARLKDDGVYVGEVMVAGAVKGTSFARGGEGIPAGTIADKFWELFRGRDAIRARVAQ